MEASQIYAFSLWQLGQTDLAHTVARSLAESVSTMEQASAAAAVILFSRFLYYISGLDSTINNVLQMPKQRFQSSKFCLIVSAIHSLDKRNRLKSVGLSIRNNLKSPEEITEMFFLLALGTLVSLFLPLKLETPIFGWDLLVRLFMGLCGKLYALGKCMQVKHGSEYRLGYQRGIDHLRKSLHLYPNSSLLRYLLWAEI